MSTSTVARRRPRLAPPSGLRGRLPTSGVPLALVSIAGLVAPAVASSG